MDLHYGNLNNDQLQDSLKENMFTAYLNEFLDYPYPNFAETTEEVNSLIRLQENVINDNDSNELLDFTDLFDSDFSEKGMDLIYKRIGIKKTQSELDYLYAISQEIGALLMKLKDIYNRPRPYQVAYYSKQNFYPFPTESGHSPSYPSGHASQSLMISKVLSFKYPSKTAELNLIAEEIAFSRLILGCHFPSDNKFGRFITNEICKKEDIKLKYFS
tara:strand:+ start:196 stop:843 length:648 start_codon:yes stop_codon:yes gene_type:complete